MKRTFQPGHLSKGGPLATFRRKYKRGWTPCGECELGRHSKCRPRCDRKLCSCSCEIATHIRERAALVGGDLKMATEVVRPNYDPNRYPS
jgi:hypothetical protein